MLKSILFYLGALFAGLLIFVGFPLLGWGLEDLTGFWVNPARVAYVWVIILLQLFALIYNPQVGRNPEQRKSDAPQQKIDLILIQIFSLAVVILAPFSDRRLLLVLNLGDIPRYLGLLMVMPGFVLMQLAEKSLDRQFSIQVTIQENHQLIQAGPYQYIRHPRYLGIIIFFLGISLVFASLLAFLLVCGLLAVLIWRIFAEEKLLQQEFGREWDEYCRKSWRIIPFIF